MDNTLGHFLHRVAMDPEYGLLRPLSDRGIRHALEEGHIRVSPRPTDGQIQPGSLDLRIGKVRVYDSEALAEGAASWYSLDIVDQLEEDPSPDFARCYPDENDVPILLPPHSFVELFFHERIDLDATYCLDMEFRSSRGRPGLVPTSTNFLMEDEQLYVSFWNHNPNAIILYGRSRFCQAFFFADGRQNGNGHIVTDPDEARSIAKKVVQGNPIMQGSHLVLCAGEHALTFKDRGTAQGPGTIDTKWKYHDEEIYVEHDLKEPLTLQVFQPGIVQLQPRVRLPPDVGLRLMDVTPVTQVSGIVSVDDVRLEDFLLEYHAANAGWVDPGYEGHVTAHPVSMKFPQTVERGMPLALGVFYKYSRGVARPYGSKLLGSHYQDSAGVGMKS